MRSFVGKGLNSLVNHQRYLENLKVFTSATKARSRDRYPMPFLHFSLRSNLALNASRNHRKCFICIIACASHLAMLGMRACLSHADAEIEYQIQEGQSFPSRYRLPEMSNILSEPYHIPRWEPWGPRIATYKGFGLVIKKLGFRQGLLKQVIVSVQR